MNDLKFYMGLLKIFARYIRVSVLDEDEKQFLDELGTRASWALEKNL